MKPVDQTQFHEPGKSRGNCQQAAVASLLGLSLDEVPNFIDQPEGFWPSFRKFIRSRGLDEILFDGTERCFPCYYLAYGPSPRGVSHAVVYKDGALAHDPHPSRAGILKVETVHLLVPSDLAEWTRYGLDA